jgi:hypothetical protein
MRSLSRTLAGFSICVNDGKDPLRKGASLKIPIFALTAARADEPE